MNKMIQDFKKEQLKVGQEVAKLNEKIAKLSLKINEQQEAVNVKRISIADEIIAKALEALTEIGCEDRLNCGEVRYVEKEVPGPVVKDMEETNKWIDKCRNLEKEMEKLKADLESERKAKGTWQSKYQNVEKEMKLLKNNHRELKKQYELLQADIEAEKILTEEEVDSVVVEVVEETEEVNDIVDELFDTVDELPETVEQSLTDEEMAKLAADAYYSEVDQSSDSSIFYSEVAKKTNHVKCVDHEKTTKTNSELLFKLNNLSASDRSNAEYFASKKHYVIASSKCENITVIPKSFDIEVTEADVNMYKNELVNKLGYNANRIEVAPVTINNSLGGNFKGIFTRIEANDLLSFNESKDVYAGYLLENYKGQTVIYLYTWNTAYKTAAFYNLNFSLEKGKKVSASRHKVDILQAKVERMKNLYFEQVGGMKKERQQEIAYNTALINEKEAKRNATNALFDSFVKGSGANENNKNNEKGGDSPQYTTGGVASEVAEILF